jgi:hypothetical protein
MKAGDRSVLRRRSLDFINSFVRLGKNEFQPGFPTSTLHLYAGFPFDLPTALKDIHNGLCMQGAPLRFACRTVWGL